MRSVAGWFERRISDGVSLGIGAASLTLLAYAAAARWKTAWVGGPEVVILAVMGSGLGLLIEPIDLFVMHPGYLCLPLLAAALVWRRTRWLVLPIISAIVAIESARAGALACFALYAVDRPLGLLAAPLAVFPAAVLTACRRWSVLSMIVLTGGLCVGVLIGVIFQHDYPEMVSPLHRFLPTAVLALFAAWVTSLAGTSRAEPLPRRFVRMWGVSTLGVACVLIAAVTTEWVRPHQPSPERFASRSAYDVHVAGDPPVLIWTDTEEIHVETAPYGRVHDSYVLSGGTHRTPQRVFSSTDGVDIQMQSSVGWWKQPPSGEHYEQEPAVRYSHDVLQDGSPSAFVEDPLTERVFVISQWGSRYVVMDRASGKTEATGRVSPAFVGFWQFSPPQASRTIRLSSAIGDGGIYELNLDSMTLKPIGSALYLYETAVDPERRIFWGARPLTGEVVGADADSLAVRYRIRTGFGSRDLQRDPRTGTLYTCTLAGEVFRIDATSLTPSKVAWCGRLCRNLFLDVRRDALWAATDDGICRYSLEAIGGI